MVKLDRLTCSVKDLGVLVETYFLAGKLVAAIGKRADRHAHHSGHMVLNILAAVSQWERETIGERTAEPMPYKRRQCESIGAEPPYVHHNSHRPGRASLIPTRSSRCSLGNDATDKAKSNARR